MGGTAFGRAFCFGERRVAREIAMGLQETVMSVWQRIIGVEAAAGDATQGRRKTAMFALDFEPLQRGSIGAELIAEADTR